MRGDMWGCRVGTPWLPRIWGWGSSQVFEFTKRSDNEQKLREIEAEAAAEEASDEASSDEWTDIDSDDDVIVPDEQAQPFTRLNVSDVPSR